MLTYRKINFPPNIMHAKYNMFIIIYCFFVLEEWFLILFYSWVLSFYDSVSTHISPAQDQVPQPEVPLEAPQGYMDQYTVLLAAIPTSLEASTLLQRQPIMIKTVKFIQVHLKRSKLSTNFLNRMKLQKWIRVDFFLHISFWVWK